VNRPGVWTTDAVSRFWEHVSAQPSARQEYFSAQVGEGLVAILRYAGALRPGVRALDWGCGVGDLAGRVCRAGVRCAGVDGSAAAVAEANAALHAMAAWEGAQVLATPPAPFPPASFDVVTCVETLEHLDDTRLDTILAEIRRLVRPGGVALFTTPNDEDLSRSETLCPFCQTTFHRMQHVRAFDARSLRALLRGAGFEVRFCGALDLTAFQAPRGSWKDWSPRRAYRATRRVAAALIDAFRPAAFPRQRGFRFRAAGGPHLCAVVERP
jgi:2-polyprenyl-3-methyl-5-hydroxy-6-metoxy-1,4-benzoquinol methylase